MATLLRLATGCAERFPTLLRTDISAFYDSVSHDYLLQVIAGYLLVDRDTPFMRIFHSLLHVPVISYSHATGTPKGVEVLQQGLPIGNSTEGVLANLYLRAVDERMEEIPNIAFGRYNDDIRIFAPGPLEAQRAVLILQEHLLAKGLNLNASKTKIAVSRKEIETLRSKAYDLSTSEADGGDAGEGEPEAPELDQPFDKFQRTFRPQDQIREDDAKDFCRFLSHRQGADFDLLQIQERAPGHIGTLVEIMASWRGATKHAAWLLAECACDERCSQATRRSAGEAITECLRDQRVTTYGKSRILHHLTKRRGVPQGENTHRLIDRLDPGILRRVIDLVPEFLKAPAFELNVQALYAASVLGASLPQLRELVTAHVAKPVGAPVENALWTLG